MILPATQITVNTARNIDPTRTIVLRNQFVSQVNKRFGDLKGAINRLLTKDNFLDPVKPTEYQPGVIPIALAAKYEYMRSDIKVEQFMGWLKDQESQGILEIIQRPGGLRRGQSQAWSDTYIRSSYSKGIAQARADLRKAGADIPSFQNMPGGLAGVFNQPFHADRVALIYTRCFNGMKGITEAMNGQLGRELALGMASGQSPYAIARRINERVDKVGIVRGRLIARTEIIQAHNEAALNEYERAEIEIGETIKVEWIATMDNRVRPHHAERDGKIYERSVAREMLGEPNCRCGLAPYVESLDKKLPKAPVKKAAAKLGKITPGSKATAEEIAAHYKKSENTIFKQIGEKEELKAAIAKRLGKRMDRLNVSGWADWKEKIVPGSKAVEEYYLSLKDANLRQLGVNLKIKNSEECISRIIQGWAKTSGDKHPQSIAMQLAAKKEFGLKSTTLWWDKTVIVQAEAILKQHEVVMRRFLREMYNDTQSFLKKEGLKTVRVVRGYKGNIGIKPSTIANKMVEGNIQLQPMSSFSSRLSTAEKFAGVDNELQRAALFFGEVPVERILSCPLTGFGCLNETEWVVLGTQKGKAEKMLISVIRGDNILSDITALTWETLLGTEGKFMGQTTYSLTIKEVAATISEVAK